MRIFHISDLHFGTRDPAKYGTESAHYFADPPQKVPKPEILAELLAKEAETRRPDVIVASGDIGWSGSADDYVLARTFFAKLKERLDVPVVICPGNHDVNLAGTVVPSARQDAFLQLLRDVHGTQFDALYPLLDAASDRRRHYLSSLHRLVGNQLTILTVNSAASIEPAPDKCKMCHQERGSRAPILVDPRVLTEWEPHLPSAMERDLRILVVHHHLLPFAEPNWNETDDPDHPPDRADPTILANSARLQPWLARNHFTLVLHGHKHQTHARHDVLLRRNDPDRGWEILILGSGSTGVAQDQRPNGEPLTFYIVECHPLRHRAYSIAAESARIERSDIGYRVLADKPKFVREVGAHPPEPPAIFQAESMVDCYRAIETSLPYRASKLFTNFISIVDEPEFRIPAEARLLKQPITLDQIENSFRTLHPEYDAIRGWTGIEDVRKTLADLPHRYSFQHGTRIFSYPLTPPSGSRPLAWIEPLDAALDSVPDHKSRAFVGLYNPFLDAIKDPASRSPPPCLTGIQFIPDGTTLHLVATFRKLELSFWWLVNMYEMIKILEHAVSSSESFERSGRITFFASLAEWRDEQPGATFSARLDKLPTRELVELLLTVDRNDASGVGTLRGLLDEKLAFINEDNIDESSLAELAELTTGITASRAAGSLSGAMPGILRNVVQHLQQARQATRLEKMRQLIKEAKEELVRARALLPAV